MVKRHSVARLSLVVYADIASRRLSPASLGAVPHLSLTASVCLSACLSVCLSILRLEVSQQGRKEADPGFRGIFGALTECVSVPVGIFFGGAGSGGEGGGVLCEINQTKIASFEMDLSLCSPPPPPPPGANARHVYVPAWTPCCFHSAVQFSSVQDGIYALGKAHMRSNSSLLDVSTTLPLKRFQLLLSD